MSLDWMVVRMPSISMFPSGLLIFWNITTNVACLFVNARGEAYISIHFFVRYLEMANKVDITNNMFRLYPYFFVSSDVLYLMNTDTSPDYDLNDSFQAFFTLL